MAITVCYLSGFLTLCTIPYKEKSLSLFGVFWIYVKTQRRLAELCSRDEYLGIQTDMGFNLHPSGGLSVLTIQVPEFWCKNKKQETVPSVESVPKYFFQSAICNHKSSIPMRPPLLQRWVKGRLDPHPFSSILTIELRIPKREAWKKCCNL